MSQCVPSWDLDHPHESSNSLPHDVPLLDYEVAELTWENGQPSMHGLGLPRAANKYAAVSPLVTITGDTLESVVNQATTRSHAAATNELVQWFDHRHEAVHPKTTVATQHSRAFIDALVPCTNTTNKNNNTQNQNQKKNNFITTNNNSSKEQQQQHSTTHLQAGISTCMVGSCSGVARTRNVGATMSLSENGGGKFNGGRDHHHHRHMAAVEGSEYLGGGGFTSEMSPENTSSGGLEYTRTSGDDSVCHSMSQRETCDEEIAKKRSGILGKSSVSTKRSRAASIHNQSERRRRDKINQRMKTLQKLVPNSSKTDKASMLDEVIEYLKQLQAQVYVMSRMNTMSPMTMLPLMQHQQLQMPCMNMMPPGMGLGMGMGLGLGSLMDFNTLIRANGGNAMPPHAIQQNASFMSAIGSWDSIGDRLAASTGTMMPPHDALSALLACQMQPTTMDSYSRLAALYQQFQQTPAAASKD